MKYFLSFRFDECHRSLWRGAQAIDVTRKAGDVLACLIERAGTGVTHEEILRSVWPDAHVQPDNIKVLVRELRRALQDDPRMPQVIRSDPGRGYTFVAPASDNPLMLPDERGGASPIFVNRAQELRQLADLRADLARSQCRLAVVEGERGMGKTALCDAFVRDARTLPPVHVCYGQCVEQAGRTEPYSSIVDALDHLARQRPHTIPAQLARHAPAWLTRLPPWVADAASPVGAVGTSSPSQMIRELSQLLETLGADGTTVIVLEDLQWGDLETIELLRGLARRHAPLRTMIVATATPFEPTLAGAGLRNLTAELVAAGRCVPVRLAPLDEDDVRDYLAQRFRSAPVEALAHTVCRLTAGNPLALVSTVDALVAADYLTAGAEGWQSRYSSRTLESSVPEAVLDVMFWRFDQLGPEDRAALETAAVVGMEFCAEDVADATGLDHPFPIVRRLEMLHRRGFIARRASRDVRPAGTIYRFIHPLHAEVLARRASPFQQLKAAERFGRRSRELGRLA